MTNRRQFFLERDEYVAGREGIIEPLQHQILEQFGSLHPSDVQRVLAERIEMISNGANERNLRSSQLALDDKLDDVAGAAGRLATLLDGLPWDTWASDGFFAEVWARRFYGTIDHEFSDGLIIRTADRPFSGPGRNLSPLTAVRAIEDIARSAAHFNRAERARGAPTAEPYRTALYNFVLCWLAFSLMCGRPLSESAPTGKNGGLRWCGGAVNAIAQSKNADFLALAVKNGETRSDKTHANNLPLATQHVLELQEELPMLAERKTQNVFWHDDIGLFYLMTAAGASCASDWCNPDEATRGFLQAWRNAASSSENP